MQVVLGQVFALLTAVCWAHNSIVYGMAGRRVGSHTVTHVRLWIALPAILLVHLVFTGRILPLGLDAKVYLFLALSGLMGFFVADLCIFRAFVVLGHRKTMVIMTLSPIVAAVLSWVFLGESLRLLQIVGILVTVGGIAWVVAVEAEPAQGHAARRGNRAGAGETTSREDADYRGGAASSAHSQVGEAAIGVALAAAGAVAQAIGMALAKAVLTDAVHPVSANVVRISAGLAGLAVFALVRGEFGADFQKMHDRKSLLLIGSGALVGPVMGIIFTLYGLKLAPVGVVTTIMQTTPIILLPIDRFVFKNKIPRNAVLGTIAAVVGAGLLFL